MYLPAGESPIVLSIETSTTLLGVSVVVGEEVVCEETLKKPRAHSVMLLPLCIEAIHWSGFQKEEISCIAVSEGPGSFTGLRIGCATAQGLALSLGRPVVLVPTFNVFLHQCSRWDNLAIVQGKAKGQTVCAFYSKTVSCDSHKVCEVSEKSSFKSAGNVGHGFSQAYGFNEVIPIGPKSFEEFYEQLLDKGRGPVGVTGDACLEFCRSVEPMVTPLDLEPVEEYWRYPRPGIVGIIGAKMFLKGEHVPPFKAIPRYYRKSQAEVRLLSRSEGDAL